VDAGFNDECCSFRISIYNGLDIFTGIDLNALGFIFPLLLFFKEGTGDGNKKNDNIKNLRVITSCTF